MPTTIQVSYETKRLLDSLKKERNLRSYDEVIGGLVRPAAGIPKSAFGSCKGFLGFEREVEAGRRTEREMHSRLAFVESRTSVVPLDPALALKAGETDLLMEKRVKGWPLADSIVLATANAKASKAVTGDPHLRGLDEVVYVG